MTIRHLKIFIAVAETGKMSLAAEKLYITQPTVSQAIRELEEHYNTLLFQRLSKKLYITESGKQLLVYAKQAVDQFERVEEKMAFVDGREKLCIGATMTVGSSLLSPILKKLSEDPTLDLYSYVGNTAAVEEKLLNAELMVGIVEGSIKSHDLVSIPVVDDSLVLVCSSSHPLSAREVLTPKDLEGQPFAMREIGSGTRELFEWYLRKKGITVKTYLEANAMDSIRQAVLTNSCMAVVSLRLMEQEIKTGSVRIFLNPSGEWNRSFKLVYHKDCYKTKGIQTLHSLLKTYQTPKYPRQHPPVTIQD